VQECIQRLRDGTT